MTCPRAMLFCLAIALLAAPCAGDVADEKVWEFTDYLKGTAPQIRDSLNKEAIRLLRRQQKLRQDVQHYEAEIARQRDAVLARVHADQQYQSTKSELDQATADLAKARASGDTEDKIEASSRFNKLRAAISAMESKAVAQDSLISDDQKFEAEARQELPKAAQSLAETLKWRAELVDALHFTFMLRWPLTSGSAGILGKVKVVAASDKATVVEFEAAEELKSKAGTEGLNQVTYRAHVLDLIIADGRLSPAKQGEHIELDRNYVVVKEAYDDNLGHLYVVRPEPADIDRVFQLIDPAPAISDDQTAPAPQGSLQR